MRVNTILTPVWTPPLDTAPHTYRRNVQLLGIWERDGRYTFDFTRLDTWLGHMRDAGLTGVEVPHLFTQWGAHACPRFGSAATVTKIRNPVSVGTPQRHHPNTETSSPSSSPRCAGT